MDNISFIPELQKQPKFNPLFWLLILATILILLIRVAKAEEPNWDELVPIIIQIESGGNPNVISEDGCIGLMQISPIVLEEYSRYIVSLINKGGISESKAFNNNLYFKDELYCPEINIKVGTWYLKRIWFHYLPYYKIPQTIDNLLIAWNWGIGNLKKWYFNKDSNFFLPLETHEYLIKYYILARLK